ncbi:MAG TPA: YfhO family protein [Bacillota bacterium]|jgi:uncharacterized membrane protein YfhO|nr:YfhO family protein [Fastidiosipila sp.]HPX93008.1 YfhO family protein [Bacillota bacterium]HQB80822.1 YfhO family protein [Bacillota bacterium]
MKDLPPGTFTLEREKRPFWNNKGLALMAFVIPFAVLGLAYGALQVFPFGGRHMLTVDLFHQYAPFLALLRNKILSGSSIFYTMVPGLGTNFYVLFAYYLASPFNLLLVFFPPAYLTEAIFVMTLVKIGCAGLTFFYYLRVSFRRRGALAVAFSSFYALSGFVLAYSWNIMWLDTLIFLPLVLLALIRQIRDSKWLLYPLSLALLLVTNYYLAFFACLFIALYYPVLLFRYTRDRKPLARLYSFGKTAGLTLIGVTLPAILLYPVYRSLALTSASGDAFPGSVELLGRPLAYLGQLFPFLEPTVRSGSPNLYCGLPVLILLPVFFLSSRIRLREKILNGFLLLFLFLSFDINVLNFLWHGMHYPNQLPFRFSFVVILLLLTLAYDGLRSMREFRPAEIGLLGLCLALAIPTVAAIEPDIKLSPWTQWGAIGLMLFYTLIFSTLRSRKYKGRLQVNLLIAIMFLELVLSTFSGLYHMDKNEYYGNRDTYSAGDTVYSIRQAIKQTGKLGGGELDDRMEIRPHKTSNDPALYGYRGLSLFASTSPADPVSFFRNFGFHNNGVNSYQYRGATLFSEALFGIRYLIVRDKNEGLDQAARQLVLGNELISVYENPYSFPIAFTADSRILDYSGIRGNPFFNQNRFAEALFGRASTLFQDLKPDESQGDLLSYSGDSSFRFSKPAKDHSADLEILWTALQTGPHFLHLDLHGHDTEKIEILIDGNRIKADEKQKGIIDLGTVHGGKNVNLSLQLSASAPESGTLEARISFLDTEVLRDLSLEANRRGIEDFTMKEDHFFGEITAEEESVLLVTVPWDPGWKAYVDGETVDILTVDRALMAIHLSAGRHRVFFAFLPVGFHEGFYLTLVSSGLLLLVAGISLTAGYFGKNGAGKKRSDKSDKEEDRESVTVNTSGPDPP